MTKLGSCLLSGDYSIDPNMSQSENKDSNQVSTYLFFNGTSMCFKNKCQYIKLRCLVLVLNDTWLIFCRPYLKT